MASAVALAVAGPAFSQAPGTTRVDAGVSNLHITGVFPGFSDHPTSPAVARLNEALVAANVRAGYVPADSDHEIPPELKAQFAALTLEEKIEFINFRTNAEYPHSQRWLKELDKSPHPQLEELLTRILDASLHEPHYLFSMLGTVEDIAIWGVIECKPFLKSAIERAAKAVPNNYFILKYGVPDTMKRLNCPAR